MPKILFYFNYTILGYRKSTITNSKYTKYCEKQDFGHPMA